MAVQCAECGFLSIHPPRTNDFFEVDSAIRATWHWSDMKEDNVVPVERRPICFARAFDLAREASERGGTSSRALTVIQAPRECEKYRKWLQGFSPREHQEMIHEADQRKLNMMHEADMRKLDDERREREQVWQEGQKIKDRMWQIIAGLVILVAGSMLTLLVQSFSQNGQP